MERDLEKIAAFFASGLRYDQIRKVGDLPVFIGYAGRGKEQGKWLCIELKEIDSEQQIRFIETHQSQLDAILGQPSKWDEHGKEGKGRGIFAVYFRPEIDGDREHWAQQIFPRFIQAAEQITQG